jgi:diaminohydroxyphosphoribosylaminopyrimidine deaminase / 5-amino-6-(5-phosphoribosylamino)uracil reductase
MKTDEAFIRRCFSLAKKGIGKVSPNPLVGAVLVNKRKIIGEGYHHFFGDHHAEINAIVNAKKGKKNIVGSTLYINLEPCFHFGKTPPCVDAIIREGIKRVVISTLDPNPIVSGKSIEKLKAHGIIVKMGVLKKEGFLLNEYFFKYITTKLPFVALKSAQTQDGFIAKENGDSKWITNIESRKYVHQIRSMYDSVLIGANTVIQDDPELTVRYTKGRNPIRIVIDGQLRTSIASKIYNTVQASTIIYTVKKSIPDFQKKNKEFEKKGVIVLQMKGKNGKLSIKQILKDISLQNISSVLVEGGSETYRAFLDEQAVDKIFLFEAKKKFGKGIKGIPSFPTNMKRKLDTFKTFGSDKFLEYTISWR